MALKRVDEQRGVSGSSFPYLARGDFPVRQDGQAQPGMGVDRVNSVIAQELPCKSCRAALVRLEQLELVAASVEQGLMERLVGHFIHRAMSFPHLSDGY